MKGIQPWLPRALVGRQPAAPSKAIRHDILLQKTVPRRGGSSAVDTDAAYHHSFFRQSVPSDSLLLIGDGVDIRSECDKSPRLRGGDDGGSADLMIKCFPFGFGPGSSIVYRSDEIYSLGVCRAMAFVQSKDAQHNVDRNL